MDNESTLNAQADGLRCLMKRKIILERLKKIQTELRQAIIAGKYKEADKLMVLLDKAQKKLEETYLR